MTLTKNGYRKVDITDHEVAAYLRRVDAIDNYVSDPAGFTKWFDKSDVCMAIAIYNNAENTRAVYLPEQDNPELDSYWYTLAAVFAITNMGQAMPEVSAVAGIFKYARHVTLNSAVMSLAQQYMESDEHEEIFLDEAKSWLRVLTLEYNKDVEAIRKVWPKHIETMEAAMKGAA